MNERKKEETKKQRKTNRERERNKERNSIVLSYKSLGMFFCLIQSNTSGSENLTW